MMLPFLPPLHNTFVNVYAGTFNTAGCVIVTAADTDAPQLSVKVIEYTPALNPVAAALVWAPGFHK